MRFQLLLVALIVIVPCVVGWLTLKYNERQPKTTQFTRVYAYQPNDVDRVAEALYPMLITNGTPADLIQAARLAYARAEALAKIKKLRNQTQK